MNPEILRDALLDCLSPAHKEPHAVSRQRRWQKKQVLDGRCRICGKAINLYVGQCDAHAAAQRLRNRKRLGCKEWKPGSRGRAPLGAGVLTTKEEIVGAT